MTACRLPACVLLLGLWFNGTVTADLPVEPAVDAAGERGVFWSLHDSQGATAGYLLGTIHSEDPRVLEFPEPLLEALGKVEVFAMEIVPDLPTLANLALAMQLPAGQSFSELAGARRNQAVTQLLSAYGIEAAQLDRLKPWAVMVTLSVPAPDTGLFMDFSLSLRASGIGLQVLGLESLEQQLAFLEQMPLAMQLEMLDQAVAEFRHIDALHEQMVNAYLRDDLDALQATAMEQMNSLDAPVREYFLERGIHDRNRQMLASLLPLLAQRPVFVAVGALHLPGEAGLLALLQEAGYTPRRMPAPFTQAP